MAVFLLKSLTPVGGRACLCCCLYYTGRVKGLLNEFRREGGGRTRDRRCGGDFLEGSDEGVCAGEALFDGRGLEGGFVGGAALPDFRDPKDIFVGCVFGDDEAEAAGDRVGVIASHDVDEFGAASGGGGEFYDDRTWRDFLMGLCLWLVRLLRLGLDQKRV